MKKHLIEVANSKGYVIRSIEEGNIRKFGLSNLITIEGGQYRIKFLTTVLYGRNYNKIIEVTDYLKEVTYKATRYHYKFIPLISSINGETHIRINKNFEVVETNNLHDPYKYDYLIEEEFEELNLTQLQDQFINTNDFTTKRILLDLIHNTKINA